MNELIKIKDMTDRYDVTARTLRYYEDMGLLASTRSDDYAYRLYDEAAVKRLEQILILRKLNVSIKDIRRVFVAPGSEVVLEVLQTKVSDIDEEVALLHELKEIIIAFIRQIEQADFSRDSDVKLLYEKAKDIEGLLEVTGQLEKKPDIVRKTRFYIILNISDSVGAYELYQRAFGDEGAEKTSEDVLPDGDIYIGMEINGFKILLRPENTPALRGGGCAVQFTSEAGLRAAYDVLAEEGRDCMLHTDAHWTPLCANLTDKYNVGWFFCV